MATCMHNTERTRQTWYIKCMYTTCKYTSCVNNVNMAYTEHTRQTYNVHTQMFRVFCHVSHPRVRAREHARVGHIHIHSHTCTLAHTLACQPHTHSMSYGYTLCHVAWLYTCHTFGCQNTCLHNVTLAQCHTRTCTCRWILSHVSQHVHNMHIHMHSVGTSRDIQMHVMALYTCMYTRVYSCTCDIL